MDDPTLWKGISQVHGLPSLTYHRYIPAYPLNLYVDYFYYLDGPMSFPQERILPLPCLDLKINLGGAMKVYAADSTDQFETLRDSWCVGLYGIYHRLDWSPAVKLFGIRLKPSGAYPFLRLPLSELHNRVVSLKVIWGRLATEIREQLADASTIRAGFTRLEQRLLAHLDEVPPGLALVQDATGRITQCHGAVAIHALSDRLGISQNHLGNQFKQLVGVTPKELARLIRFEYVLHTINPLRPINWAHIAHECGYYDQAHFNKDFVAFTGYTPTDYLPHRRRAQLKNAVPSLSLRDLPID